MGVRYGWVIALSVVSCACLGCGGDKTSEVTGKITLDGQPLPNATVSFLPKGPGTAVFGRTDSQGVYTLYYATGDTGAPPGEYIVMISTFSDGDPDSDPPTPASPEKVPVNYNTETELTATVGDGPNQIDFDLTSGEQVVQPPDPNSFDN